MNVYMELTKEFNSRGLVSVIASGQAVVLHRLAVMSKDGDWILREDPGALRRVLTVLAGRDARYRFGAPLDVRWMAGGWSSYFEFRSGPLRARTDFFTRPPRISVPELERVWRRQEGREIPFVDLRTLAEMKKTNREKDYAVIGELGRMMPDVSDQMLFSRSARDLIRLAEEHPDAASRLSAQRAVLKVIAEGRKRLEEALDAERRELIHANEQRLKAYMAAAEEWAALWPDVAREIAGVSLTEAHEIVVRRAQGVLPYAPEQDR